ncbi:hypothetical protein [Actinomadura atramentaria]|uniref:hypothetical protein n=1 Tax=Actinomadura atramentaria TaxID=1990 RepID=UPI000380E7B0|nr:hypothetical protein [Actinomadura atramentaria]
MDDIRVRCAFCGAGDRADDLIEKMLNVSSAYVEWRRREESGPMVRFGGSVVMRERLAHLSAVTKWPNALLGVIPFTADCTDRL